MKISYKTRFLTLIFVFLAFTAAVITFIGVKVMRNAVIKSFSERGIAVVYKAKAMIDAEEFENLVNAGTKDYPYYDILYKQLFELKKEQLCRYLYTMVQVEGTTFKYIVDGSGLPGTDDFSEYGEEEDISSYGHYPFDCLEMQDVIVSEIEKQDDWGWVISIYAPILKNGKSIGFVGCDFDAQVLVSNIRKNIALMIGISLSVGIFCMTIMALYIGVFFRRVEGIRIAMQDISSGARDLTQRLVIKGDTELDQLGLAYNDVIEQLQEMVKTITSSVKSLSENSNVLLQQNNETMTLIENAKTSIEEIYAKADDQNMLSTQVSSGISSVETAVKDLDNRIIQQSEAVEKSSSAVEEINDSIRAANEVIERISSEYAIIVDETEDGKSKQNQVSAQVDLIVQQAQNLAQANSVISSIASQTNLLAMNAAIEAAHAGEQGKGFAVVADEIRKLAENSSKQSKSVKELIDNIENSVSGIVSVSQSSAQSFSSLGEKIQGMNSLLAEIKSDMEKQNIGAQNIMDMMSLLTNAASSIKDSSEMMKNNTMSVVSQMEELKQSSQSILESGNAANEQLSKMSEFAVTTTTQAQENAELSTKVDQIVSSYKVEEA